MIRAVCTQAWRLIKRTSSIDNLSLAFKLAWRIIRFKIKVNFSKVRGVTFDHRQKLLKRLSLYPITDVRLIFVREPDNQYDANAIKVLAEVKGKGSAMIGYVSKEIAATLSPELDNGKQALVMFEGVTDNNSGLLGCNFSFFLF